MVFFVADVGFDVLLYFDDLFSYFQAGCFVSGGFCLVAFLDLVLMLVVYFFYFINFAPDKCRKCVLSCFVITFHVPILAWLLLLSCWIFCVTQCSWSSFFVGGKITFVLKQTEKERECVKKTKLGDHNCITNYFFFLTFLRLFSSITLFDGRF